MKAAFINFPSIFKTPLSYFRHDAYCFYMFFSSKSSKLIDRFDCERVLTDDDVVAFLLVKFKINYFLILKNIYLFLNKILSYLFEPILIRDVRLFGLDSSM